MSNKLDFFKKRTDNPLGYVRVHQWLLRNFGKATRCENKKCPFKGYRFEWALRKGEFYQKNRKVFIMLCRGCHSKYDGNNNPPSGERQWRAKLKSFQVVEIRKLYNLGKLNQREIGLKFGVRQDSISRIINKLRWKHI